MKITKQEKELLKLILKGWMMPLNQSDKYHKISTNPKEDVDKLSRRITRYKIK